MAGMGRAKVLVCRGIQREFDLELSLLRTHSNQEDAKKDLAFTL